MELEVKRALFLHVNKGLTENQLFNRPVDIAGDHQVELVMARIPPEYLAMFRNWVKQLPSPDTLINLKSGAISQHEKDTLGAVRDWLDRHPGDHDSKEETQSPSSGPSDAGSEQIVGHSGVPAPRGWPGTGI